jgi:C4-type Zn-finger protein
MDRSEFEMDCPVCEEQTHWTVAFEGEGVSF